MNMEGEQKRIARGKRDRSMGEGGKGKIERERAGGSDR